MKQRIILLWLLLPTLFLVSCDKDNIIGDAPGTGGEPGNGGEIRFEIGFESETRVSTDAAFNSLWENGDEIGVFAVSYSTGTTEVELKPSGNYIHNVKLTYNGDTWTPERELYFDGDNSLSFYAYYPYDEGAADPTNIVFNVKANQGTAKNYSASDLLTAKADNGGAGYSKETHATTPILLSFSHALSLVQLEIPVQGKGYGPSENLAVTLQKVRTGATLNLGAVTGPKVTLSATATNTENITMYRVEQPDNPNYGTTYTYRALVPAQTVTEGVSLFRFEHEERLMFGSNALASQLTMAGGKAEKYKIALPATTIHTVYVPAGTFWMGSPETEPDRDTDETRHEVTITKPFRMGKYEVTNAHYAAFLNAENIGNTNNYAMMSIDGASRKLTVNSSLYFFKIGVAWDDTELLWKPVSGYEDYPATYITWYGAKAYADWILGSLPTEAQWEYACRAETETPWATASGTDFDFADYGWCASSQNSGDYPNGTRPVGLKKPNLWGLYDMHGNVEEWCSDWYGAYGAGAAIDPEGPETSINTDHKVMRGGCWGDYEDLCRSARRYPLRELENPLNSYGFRVVFSRIKEE